jgi:hypothetical protein
MPQDRSGDGIMGCFEDYMQFRDEVEAAKMKIKGKDPAKKTAARQISQETKNYRQELA